MQVHIVMVNYSLPGRVVALPQHGGDVLEGADLHVARFVTEAAHPLTLALLV